MKIEVSIAGATISERWNTAKVACITAIVMAANRCQEVAMAHKNACGQNTYGFKVPDGEQFRDVAFHAHAYTNPNAEGYEIDGIVGGYSERANVRLAANEHWTCSLSSIVELTVALNCWTPTIPED